MLTGWIAMNGRRAAALVILAASTVPAPAEVRRALLVGIDQYIQPASQPGYRMSEMNRKRLEAIQGKPSRAKLSNLDGAVNDAEGMKEILIERFGFEERNIIVLPNREQEATAENILKLLQSHLIDAAQDGDVSLFYYAGHGSRIRNRAVQNRNISGLDSTIIPADALLGVPDIRSKELARIYAQAPRKNVTLTVIQDSCYSGGSSRGIATRKIRAEPADAGVSVNEAVVGPLPEDQGVLVISASQDYEPAAELPETDLNAAHGAFTWALLHVLAASPPNESTDRIFQRTRSLLQSMVPDQEPVLLAKQGRNRRGLFGQAAGAGQEVTVAVGHVAGSVIKLNGGLAMNLQEGCELKRVAPAGPPVEIRITKVSGLASADAQTPPGTDTSSVHAGDLFEITKWVAPDREQLRVYLGSAASKQEINRALEVFGELRSDASADWITDPSKQPATHVLSWDAGQSRWSWKENRSDTEPAWLDRLSSKAIAGLVAKAHGKPRIFLSIPAPEGLDLQLDGNVAVVRSAALADYLLLGRPCPSAQSGCAEYAWMLPDQIGDPEKVDRPPRTDWVQPGTGALRNAALGLARVLAWTRLRSPGFDDAWPYRLALQSSKTKRILDSSIVTGGESYKLLLRAEPGGRGSQVQVRRVYVFAVDSYGKATMLFGNNLENEFPRMDNATGGNPETIALTNNEGDIRIMGPYGTDNYYLLSSVTPIDNPESVFNFEGVRIRGMGTPKDPLTRLLENTASGARGGVGNVPATWSIQRMTLVSRPPGNRILP
jgi:Caspase domain